MNSDQTTHWRRTRSLMWVTLAIWFYMAAQGSLVVFVVLIFWFARAQDKIDRECGMAEDD